LNQDQQDLHRLWLKRHELTIAQKNTLCGIERIRFERPNPTDSALVIAV